jgi:hypothetical protein
MDAQVWCFEFDSVWHDASSLPPISFCPCSDMSVSHEIAKSLNLLFGGVDMDATGGRHTSSS